MYSFQQMEKKHWFKSRPILHAPFQVNLFHLYCSLSCSCSCLLHRACVPAPASALFPATAPAPAPAPVSAPAATSLPSGGRCRLLPPSHGAVCLRSLPSECEHDN